MSWVADVNATNQNMASVSWKNRGEGIVNAIPANPIATSHCMSMVHRLLVLIISTKGLQKGFMTHGR